MAPFKLTSPLTAPLILLKPTYSTVQGVATKTYPIPDNGILFYGNFRTFGGTEREINGVYSIENTATIETWYNTDVASNCRVYNPHNGKTYEVIGEPENIGLRNQYLQFKVQEIRGGV